MYLITGGCGFIGSYFAKMILSNTREKILNIDKLTYAGNKKNLGEFFNHPNHTFIRGDICDSEVIKTAIKTYKPRIIINFAAETHVDTSIHTPDIFCESNIIGTLQLLKQALVYWENNYQELEEIGFKFIQVSTDEVFGSLNQSEKKFTEESPICPNSPYSASKAGADHLVRAFNVTHGLPTIISRCSNNFGPNQFAEKLIPVTLRQIVNGGQIPVYGDGLQIRDWIHVSDHCKAIALLSRCAKTGESYNVAGNNEITNLALIKKICEIAAAKIGKNKKSILEQIEFVTDRKGHDWRYGVDTSKIELQLNWRPKRRFHDALVETVHWYINNS